MNTDDDPWKAKRAYIVSELEQARAYLDLLITQLRHDNKDDMEMVAVTFFKMHVDQALADFFLKMDRLESAKRLH
jgi:hypothetical protein